VIERLSTVTLPTLEAEAETHGDTRDGPHVSPKLPHDKAVYIFPYGVARNKLERAIREMGLNAVMARHLEDADVIITVKQQERRDAHRLEEAVRAGIPVHVIRSNTYQQIVGALHDLYHMEEMDTELAALHEARAAIREVLATSHPVELTPRNAYLRRLQHQLAEQHQLFSESVGSEPYRRVRIMKE